MCFPVVLHYLKHVSSVSTSSYCPFVVGVCKLQHLCVIQTRLIDIYRQIVASLSPLVCLPCGYKTKASRSILVLSQFKVSSKSHRNWS